MSHVNYSKDLEHLLAGSTSLDAALSAIREKGASKIESINAVRDIRQCSLSDAKKIVHFSPSWADVRESHEELHRELGKAFEDEDENEDELKIMRSRPDVT